MKNLLLFLIFICSAATSFAQKAKIRKDLKYYIGKTFKIDTLDKASRKYGYSEFYLDLQKDEDKSNRPYRKDEYASYTVYDSLVNKTFKCIDAGVAPAPHKNRYYIKLEQGPGRKPIYYLYKDFSTTFDDVICLDQAADDERDAKAVTLAKAGVLNKSIDSLKAIYLGKTIWANTYFLLTHNEATGVYDGQTIEDLRFSALKILNITASPSQANPIRFTFQTAKGLKGYADVVVAINPLDVGDRPSVNPKQERERPQTIEKRYFLKDPKITYNLTPARLAIVKKGELNIGIDRDLFMLIHGKADKINFETGGEQWVYDDIGGPHYFYFRNGKYTGRN